MKNAKKIKLPVALLGFLVMTFVFFSCEDKEDGKEQPEATTIIETVTPLIVTNGTEVKIKGSLFPDKVSDVSVFLGDVSIIPTSVTPNEIKFAVPNNVAKGQYALAIKVKDVRIVYDKEIEVTFTEGGFISDAKIPISAEEVQKCFIGVGKEGKHPRLFYDDQRIEDIKAIIANDPQFAGKTYVEILSTSDAILSTPLKKWGLDNAGLRISAIHEVGNKDLPMLSFAYLLTKDAKYAQRCYEQMKAMCTWSDWGANRHFLDTGIGARGFAMAYDAIYNYLSAEQRAELVAGLRKHALEPGKKQIETGEGAVWGWYNSDDNWNGICNGGLICAALAVYETDPVFMSQLIASAANKIPPYIHSFNPDGASEEGMMYWDYGLTNSFLSFEAMKRILSTTYGLIDIDGLKKAGWFPYLMSGPVATATMGDDYVYNGKTNKFLSYFWFAKTYNDANLAKKHYNECMSRQSKMNGYLDLLFFDPQLVQQGSEVAIPLNGYVQGADFMFVRENNTSDDALYIGMHGGDNNASHGHLDAGTFMVQILQENLFVGNLGKPDPYPGDYFTITSPDYNSIPTTTAGQPGRYYYYRVRTEGKSCIVLNPDARPEQNPQGKSTKINEMNDASGGFYILDLQQCYSRDVSSYKRGIKLNRNNKIITIQDELTPKNSSTVYWIAHTPLAQFITLSSDKKSAVCDRNGKKIYLSLSSSHNAEFEIVLRNETDINYLDETKPIFGGIMKGKNPINKWYGKLQIKLTNVSQPATICVKISTSQIDNSNYTLMDQWSTSN